MTSKSNRPMQQMDRIRHLLASSLTSNANEDHSFVADLPAYLFGYRYGLHTLYKKLDLSTDSKALHTKCEATYLATEERISQVNRRLVTSLAPHGDARLKVLISSIGRKIREMIGDGPDVREFALACGWGPGATLSLKSVDATLDNKLIEPRLTVTPKCSKYAVAYLSSSLLWMRARLSTFDVDGPCSPLRSEFDYVHWGRFSSVPKDTERRRPIDVQPTLNLFFQKGAGALLRRRLKRQGINLDDQSRNQRLAGAAYTHGLSTIDLEAASDSVSTELVRAVLPPKWFDFLDDLRTPAILLSDGQIHNLSKFSSMGNGFTFELESLIFYALCHTVVRDLAEDGVSPIAVYGDDLIVSSRHYDALTEALQLLGFVINTSKSFKEGNFFESCGKHYYKGFDVTPPYQKAVCVTAHDWVRFANRLWRWAFRLGGELCVDSAIRPAFEECSNYAHGAWAAQFHSKRKRNGFIPLPVQPWWLEGDGGLISLTTDFPSDKNGILRIDQLTISAKRRPGYNPALYAESLRSASDSGSSDQASYGLVTLRGRVKESLTRRRVYVTEHWVPEWL